MRYYSFIQLFFIMLVNGYAQIPSEKKQFEVLEKEILFDVSYPWGQGEWIQGRLPHFQMERESYHKTKRILRFEITKELRKRFRLPSLLFPVHNHPHRIYKNGQIIYSSGIGDNFSTTDVAISGHLLSLDGFKQEKDTVDVEYFSSGMHHVMVIPQVGSLSVLQVENWWRNLSYHWVMLVFISVSFILFVVFIVMWWVRREEKSYLNFSLLTLALSLAYIDTAFSNPTGDSLVFWKMSRIGFVMAALCLFLFTQSISKVKISILWIRVVSLVSVFFVVLLGLEGNHWGVEIVFSQWIKWLSTPIFISIPLMLLAGMQKDSKDRSVLFFLLVGSVLLILGAIADIEALKSETLPYNWWIPYGYFFFELCVLYVLAIEEVKLVMDLKFKTISLSDKNRMLELSKEAEARANRAKNHFLKNVAHELKTPMNGFRGLAEMALHENSDRNESYTDMLMMSDRLSISLDNLLDISALENNEMKLNKMTFDTESFCKQLQDILTAELKSVGVQFNMVAHALPQKLEGDRRRLSQIICNLVWWRMSLAHSGGKLSLSMNWQDEVLNIELEDSWQNFEGALVSFMESKIASENLLSTAESKDLGMNGSLVLGLLPIMKGNISFDIQENETHTQTIVLNLRSYQGVYAKELSVENLKVLLVEDNMMNAKIAMKLLMSKKMQVRHALNGEDGLNILMNEYFDLILMDIQMPIMDGIEATYKIRALEDKEKARIPIIALTANQDSHECLSAGMNGYLSKPLRREDLFAGIAEVLKDH